MMRYIWRKPQGYVSHEYHSYVCKLNKPLYGLKQAPRQWFQRQSSFLCSHGFHGSKADMSLFILAERTDIIYLLCYVDDLIITGTRLALVDEFIKLMQREFPIKDLGNLHYFFGVEVHHLQQGLLVTQSKYIHDHLTKTKILECKPCATPMASTPILSKELGFVLHDGEEYRRTVGALNFSR